jgi:dTDP-4-dehydrorhamnose reductase
VIVNAAAYTAVDRAESEPDLAMAVNAITPGILAEEARKLNAGLIHYSTDYVFDGTKGAPYNEEDTVNSINAYGRSKLAGEQSIAQVGGAYLILRTSWVYSLRRPSFITKTLQWARTQSRLKIVTDQIGSPTWCRMLAVTIALLLARALPDAPAFLKAYSGIYHLAGLGSVSRMEAARFTLENDPALTADFPTPAQRPLFSALNCTRFAESFGINMPEWKESLCLTLE